MRSELIAIHANTIYKPPSFKRKVEIFSQVENVERKPTEDKKSHHGKKKTTAPNVSSFI